MDNELFDALNGVEMDAPGIDWNAFISRKRKKRRAIIFWWTLAGCALLLISAYLVCNSSTPVHKIVQANEKQQQSQADLEHTETKTPQQTNDRLSEPGTAQTESSVDRKMLSNPATSPTGTGKAGENPVKKYHVSSSSQTNERLETPHAPEPVTENEKEISPALSEGVIKAPTLASVENTEGQYRLGILPLKKHVFSFGNTSILKAKNKQVKIDRSTVFVQFQAGPAFNFPTFSVSDAGRAFIHKDYKGIRSASETGLLGYGFQLAAGKTFRKLDVAFGIGISNARIFGHYDFTYSEKPILNPDGTVVGYNATSPTKVSFKSTQSYTFVEMPLYLDYQLFKGKQIKTSVHAGLLNQFLKQISGEQPNALFMNFKDILSTENFRSYSANIELGCRVAYLYKNKTELGITPVYRRNFGVQQAQSYYKSDFNAFVIQFSLRKYL